MTVGFVGLGAMGGAMATRLLDAGESLTVYNRTVERCAPAAERGASVATSPAEAAADAEVVFVCVSTGEVAETLLFGDAGVVVGLPSGGIVVDMSTVAPAQARQAAARMGAVGLHALDACVVGSPRHAASGELRFLIGGEAETIGWAEPVVRHLAANVTHVGGSGMGTTAKLALQLVKGAQIQSLAEAIVFGERAGLDRQVLIDLITGSGFSSPVMKVRGGVMARRSFGEHPNFRLDLMRKDLGLVLAECQRMGVPAPVTSASHESLTGAVNRGLGKLDCAAVLAFLEDLAGVPGYPWPGGGSGLGGRQLGGQ